ncbi:MAG TPA: flagellar protein FlaG [Bacillota bacterium]
MRSQPVEALEQEAQREFTRAEIERSLETINRAAFAADERVSFVLHDGSGRLMVQVLNGSTGEVIKEIPPREILDAEARIREMIGLFLNEKV